MLCKSNFHASPYARNMLDFSELVNQNLEKFYRISRVQNFSLRNTIVLEGLDFRIPRQRMVDEQLIARGIRDQAVLQAMATVPRHLFVPEALASTAYDDRPLPIGYGQTISQPYVVAAMLETLHLAAGMSILEVGTGSGYQAAVMHAMRLKVITVERLAPLYHEVKARFSALRLQAICTLLGDGTLGWPPAAPYDRIIVAAGGPGIPENLAEQLALDGILIIPVGKKRGKQRLTLVHRRGDSFHVENASPVSFVDLIGKAGWGEE